MCTQKIGIWLSWRIQRGKSIIFCLDGCCHLPSKTQQNNRWLLDLFCCIQFINCWEHLVYWCLSEICYWQQTVLLSFMLYSFLQTTYWRSLVWEIRKIYGFNLSILEIYFLIKMLWWCPKYDKPSKWNKDLCCLLNLTRNLLLNLIWVWCTPTRSCGWTRYFCKSQERILFDVNFHYHIILCTSTKCNLNVRRSLRLDGYCYEKCYLGFQLIIVVLLNIWTKKFWL